MTPESWRARGKSSHGVALDRSRFHAALRVTSVAVGSA